MDNMNSNMLAGVNVTVAAVFNLTTVGPTLGGTTTGSPMSDFYKNYSQVHGYISDIVCIFGVLSNILNVIVLTRRHMISPTNCILTALAIADFLTMLTYLVYATYFYIVTEPRWEVNHSMGWMYFIMIHNHFIITCHNMAMWFTVSLALFRYIFVGHHPIANRVCSMYRAKLAIMIIIVATVIVCIPNYALYKVVPLSEVTSEENQSGYWIIDSDFAQAHSFYKVVTFWVYGVIIKVAPCILLTLLSSSIILTMHQASKRRVRLLAQKCFSDHDTHNEHNRTTYMLVSVVLFFVITEFPQGILAMISGLDDTFFEDVYSNLGDVMDLLVLLNSAVNFILYCIMSQQFRDTFRSLFVGKWMCRYAQYGKVNGHTGGNGMSQYTTGGKTEATML